VRCEAAGDLRCDSWSFLSLLSLHSCRSVSHVTRRTSHVTRHTSLVTRQAQHVTRHTSHVTRHTSHVTRHTSHVTRHTSHVTRHTSHVTRQLLPSIVSLALLLVFCVELSTLAVAIRQQLHAAFSILILTNGSWSRSRTHNSTHAEKRTPTASHIQFGIQTLAVSPQLTSACPGSAAAADVSPRVGVFKNGLNTIKNTGLAMLTTAIQNHNAYLRAQNVTICECGKDTPTHGSHWPLRGQ
jgi:hypothetical protein